MKLKEDKSRFDILIGLLSLISGLIVIIDEKNNFNYEFYILLLIISCFIWLIFFVEFIYKFSLSKYKLSFFLYNKIDLLSLIPYYIFIYMLKNYDAYRFLILIHILKIIKFSVMMIKFEKRIFNNVKNNRILYLFTITISIIIIGSMSISIVEKKSFSDSLWLTIVTITTVGYGDIKVNTKPGRFIAGILMVIGVGFAGLLTGAISSYFIKGSFKKNSNFEIEKIKKKLDSFDDLTDKEILDICDKLKKLKEKEK
ncbi:potassium channel family protein [Clostridium sp. BJN0001]|uniref:potassium channel family protein n=1 Tax=Clostridium sp. BJN0001 TaxID=2930219 RepID=UPI001FD4B278|nr:potassium channel family protein [Clostridium sp. BJN0001]